MRDEHPIGSPLRPRQPDARASSRGRAPGRRRRAGRAVLATGALLLGVLGCQETAQQTSRTAFVRRLAEMKGEDSILKAEDLRLTGGGQLLSFLNSGNAELRRRTALAAGRLRDPSLLPKVRELAGDVSPEVRAMALFALSLYGDPALAGDIEAHLGDADGEVRLAAVDARGRLGGPSLPAPIRALLVVDTPDARAEALVEAACLAAGRFSDTSAAAALEPLLGHPNPEVRWKAAWALSRLRQSRGLRARLADPDPRVRAYAALGLGAAGARDATPELVALLADPSVSVAAAAAEALGVLADGRAAARLSELARTGSGRRRFAAIQALARSAVAPGTLRELLQDQSPVVRSLAVDGLRRARTGREDVLRASGDADWRVRAAAARALAAFGDTETLAKTMLYDNDARVLPAILEGLAQLRYRDLDTILLKHMGDKDPAIRATAVRLSRGRRIPGLVDRLVLSWEAAHNDALLVAKLAVIDALGERVDDDKAVNIIKQGAMDKEWLVKSHAYRLLERLGLAQGIQAPGPRVSLRTESYYRDVAWRSDYEQRLTLATERGNVVFRLFPKDAPLTVRFLDEVASTDYYTGQAFTTIDPAFELRFGDDRGDGLGHFPAWVRDEPSPSGFRGTNLTLRRELGRDSASSQILITYLPRPELDTELAVLGEIYQGEEILDELVPGDGIRSVEITSHEYRGKTVAERVRVDEPEPTPTPAEEPTAPVAAPVVEPGAFARPATFNYLAIVGLVLLLASLLPLVASAERREDFPPALWIVLLIILSIDCFYAWLSMSGGYFGLLTAERPGPRFKGLPNPPIMPDDTAMLLSTAAMCYVVAQMAFLYLLVSGKRYARWLYVFLTLIEIALLASQIATRSTPLAIISNVAVALNLFKLWFLIMDKSTKRYFNPELEEEEQEEREEEELEI